jgi:hypothetical protein
VRGHEEEYRCREAEDGGDSHCAEEGSKTRLISASQNWK